MAVPLLQRILRSIASSSCLIKTRPGRPACYKSWVARWSSGTAPAAHSSQFQARCCTGVQVEGQAMDRASWAPGPVVSAALWVPGGWRQRKEEVQRKGEGTEGKGRRGREAWGGNGEGGDKRSRRRRVEERTHKRKEKAATGHWQCLCCPAPCCWCHPLSPTLRTVS